MVSACIFPSIAVVEGRPWPFAELSLMFETFMGCFFDGFDYC
jgi:hypothetical protein